MQAGWSEARQPFKPNFKEPIKTQIQKASDYITRCKHYLYYLEHLTQEFDLNKDTAVLDPLSLI